MGLFGRTKQLTSDEYADILAKLTKIAQEVAVLTVKMDTLESRQNSLRGLVNRKGFKEVEEEEPLSDMGALQLQQKRLLGLPD